MTEEKPPVRVWADGCFDMMHWGHANVLRQAKALGDVLIVGVHSDDEIDTNKGPTVMKNRERYEAVRACRWVDGICEDAPYNTQIGVLDEYNIDFCVHGDDVSTDADGNDTYAEVKAQNRFKVVKRTSFVSTTDLVGRMLLMTKERISEVSNESEKQSLALRKAFSDDQVIITAYESETNTFKDEPHNSALEASSNHKIVYIDGAFDIFHAGHAEGFRLAKEMGDYLIVGIHSDKLVNSVKGQNNPIQRIHERLLSVLACKYVNRVVLNAPWKVSKEFIAALSISAVAYGAVSDYDSRRPSAAATSEQAPSIEARHSVPKEMGIFRRFSTSFPDLTTSAIVRRIIENRMSYEERNNRKLQKENIINPEHTR